MRMIVLLIVAIAAGAVRSAPTTAPAEATQLLIKNISTAEKLIHSVYVRHFTATVQTKASADAQWSDTPIRYVGSAWYEDPTSNGARIYFSEYVMPWVNGAADWTQQSVDVSFDGKKGRTLSISNGSPNHTSPDRSGIIEAIPPMLLASRDARFASGIGFSLQYMIAPDHFKYPPEKGIPLSSVFSQALAHGAKPQLTQEKLGDFSAAHLTFGGPLGCISYWFAPDRGYALLKYEERISPRGKTEIDQFEVTELKEAAPGIWFPMKGVMDIRDYAKPNARYRLNYEAEDVIINSPDRDKHRFDVKFPAGYIVRDITQNNLNGIVMPDGSIQPLHRGQVVPNVKPGEYNAPDGP